MVSYIDYRVGVVSYMIIGWVWLVILITGWVWLVIIIWSTISRALRLEGVQVIPYMGKIECMLIVER